jgi:hypothetical protein
MMRLWISLLLAWLAFGALPNVAQASGPDAETSARVGELIQAAKTQLRPPTAAEVAQAKASLVAADREIRASLVALPDGRSRLAKLGLDALEREINAAQADPEKLAGVWRTLHYHRLDSDALGSLESALAAYVDQLRLIRNPGATEEYTRRIDNLSKLWSNYASRPSPQAWTELEDAYGQLLSIPHTRELMRAFRERASHPNHILTASEDFLQREISAKTVRKTIAIHENSSGTKVTGSGELAGNATIDLRPSLHRAETHVAFSGVMNATVTGRKGPAVVYERGPTTICAQQVAYMSQVGMVKGPAQINVHTDIRPYSVRINLECRLLRRVLTPIVWKVAWKQKADADRKTEAKVRKEIEEQLAQQMDDAMLKTARLAMRFLPPTADPSVSTPLQLSTTDTQLRWAGEFVAPGKLGAPSEPPPLTGALPVLMVQMHESALNNAENYLKNRTISEPDFRELIFDTLALTPEVDETSQRGRIPGSITLAGTEPLAANFDDGRGQASLRIQAFESDGKRYGPGDWTVTATYATQIGSQGLELIRNDKVQVRPAGSPDSEVLRTMMERFFARKAKTTQRTLIGDIGEQQNLRVRSATIDDGWLTVAWDQDPAAAPPTPPPSN